MQEMRCPVISGCGDATRTLPLEFPHSERNDRRGKVELMRYSDVRIDDKTRLPMICHSSLPPVALCRISPRCC